VHTHLSADAYPLGSRTTPDEAYRFAKGEQVISNGLVAQLATPLDFLMVSDHAENMGVFPRIAAGDPSLLKTESGRTVFKKLKNLPPADEVLASETEQDFRAGAEALSDGKAMKASGFIIDKEFKQHVWHSVVDMAEKHNDPGNFTTFSGYEYSSGGLHRNVLFAGGPEHTKKIIPFSSNDSNNPEDLWSFLEWYIETTGSGVISIPHNSNLSGGKMFASETFDGLPLTKGYALTRSSIEPVVEVTQIKGDSETHPLLSPHDEFASFEDVWWDVVSSYRSKNSSSVSEKKIAQRSFVRAALKTGLDQQADIAVNPFKFGIIGSTDSHTGLATADENNFWGKMATDQPNPFRAARSSIFSASGYAAIWATENTRAAIFSALKRREVYATTGPRIILRFFGGWDFGNDDVSNPNIAEIGYKKGVPMGGELVMDHREGVPHFLIAAMREPDGANLDRLQIIKGWRDQQGKLHEKVYDVAWSGERTRQENGKLPPIRSTVNLSTADYRNSVGSPALEIAWKDPDFHPDESAFYYARVLQIPTPRWNTYDASVYRTTSKRPSFDPWGGKMDPPPTVIQERAYSSPIWYESK
tara:strand:- start:504 stop:2261 length:1758 start_codon:yes stop_codon:yes gene_type:complete